MHNQVLCKAMNSTVGQRSYGSITEMFFRGSDRPEGNHANSSSLDHRARHELCEAIRLDDYRLGTTQYKPEGWDTCFITQIQERPGENPQGQSSVRWKADDHGPDLNLSLNIGPRQEKKQRWEEEEEVDSSLSLSLFSPSMIERCSRDAEKALKHNRWEEGVGKGKNTRVTSTLDLTI